MPAFPRVALDHGRLIRPVLAEHPAGITAHRIAACLIDRCQAQSSADYRLIANCGAPILGPLTDDCRDWLLAHQDLATVDRHGRWHARHQTAPAAVLHLDQATAEKLLRLYRCGASLARCAAIARASLTATAAWLATRRATRAPDLHRLLAAATL